MSPPSGIPTTPKANAPIEAPPVYPRISPIDIPTIKPAIHPKMTSSILTIALNIFFHLFTWVRYTNDNTKSHELLIFTSGLD